MFNTNIDDLKIRDLILVIIMRWATCLYICHTLNSFIHQTWIGKMGIYLAVDYLIGGITRLMIFRMDFKDAFAIIEKTKTK